MRFAIVLAAAALVAAPAVAQRVVPTPVAPPADKAPPEGFYKDIPNMYDLLARPVPLGSIMMVNGRRLCPALPASPTDKDRMAQKTCRGELFGDSRTPPAQVAPPQN